MAISENTPPPVNGLRRVLLGVMLPAGFLLLTLLLLESPRLTRLPIAPASVVNRESLVVGPRRVAMTDPPYTIVGGVAQNCNACHQIFQSVNRPAGTLNYHQEIDLLHGLNDRCVNCHDASNLERFMLRDGSTLSFAQTPQLCSQCHGTVYRDWERGTHGKTLGSWMTGSAKQRRLSCNECHDPHSPRFEPYVPLPAPNTLRMGDQGDHEESGGKRNPLQRWLMEHRPPGTPEDRKEPHP